MERDCKSPLNRSDFVGLSHVQWKESASQMLILHGAGLTSSTFLTFNGRKAHCKCLYSMERDCKSPLNRSDFVDLSHARQFASALALHSLNRKGANAYTPWSGIDFVDLSLARQLEQAPLTGVLLSHARQLERVPLHSLNRKGALA